MDADIGASLHESRNHFRDERDTHSAEYPLERPTPAEKALTPGSCGITDWIPANLAPAGGPGKDAVGTK